MQVARVQDRTEDEFVTPVNDGSYFQFTLLLIYLKVKKNNYFQVILEVNTCRLILLSGKSLCISICLLVTFEFEQIGDQSRWLKLKFTKIWWMLKRDL